MSDETENLAERRPWQAKQEDPACNANYAGAHWLPKPCIKKLGHGGFHADWYGRTW